MVDPIRLSSIPTTPSAQPLIGAIRAFVRSNYHLGIGLGDVAREFGYTTAYLTARFRMTTGMPLHAWIIEFRIAAARERLRATDEPIARVAESVGFLDVAYFGRQFSRKTGMSPSVWRATNLPTAQRARPRSRSAIALSRAPSSSSNAKR